MKRKSDRKRNIATRQNGTKRRFKSLQRKRNDEKKVGPRDHFQKKKINKFRISDFLTEGIRKLAVFFMLFLYT